MAANSLKIASKYMLGPKIGSGSFGEVYVVNLIGTAQIYALKREDEKSKSSQIIIQYKILKQMENIQGFAKVHWQGTQNKYNIMVMDMLGPSLQDLFQICGKNFSLKTTIMIADQMVQRIEQLHNHNYIHRDIKPQNFLMGIKKNSHIVHLIDFGLSKKYRDSKNLQHIPYKQNKNLTGTARYASINAHLGIEQSRRDDLQAIGYVILYFRQGFLPWQGIKANNKNEKYQKIMQKKMSIPIEVQCKGLPLQISTFISYCRSLKFNEKPDYAFLRRLLRQLLQRQGHKFDYCYDWTIIKQNKTLDNGKIKLQLKSNYKQSDDLLIQSRGSQLFKSMKGQKLSAKILQPPLRQNSIKKSSQNSQSGEQNIDESGLAEQSQQHEKKIDLLLDLEEKKNNMYDSDNQIL